MKTNFAQKSVVLGLFATSLALCGCVVSIGGRNHPSPPSPPPPPVVITDPGQAATVAEIDAAAQLNMDSARSETLAQIAQRPALSPPVQVHLVNVAYHCLSFENSKVHVLSRVIARPDFCDGARQAIVTQLNTLGFDSNRQSLLKQINSRMSPQPNQ